MSRIKIKSAMPCDRCKKTIAYPFLHICNPNQEPDEDEIFERQAGGEMVMS